MKIEGVGFGKMEGNVGSFWKVSTKVCSNFSQKSNPFLILIKLSLPPLVIIKNHNYGKMFCYPTIRQGQI
jgi:hypothetical protein